MYSFDWQIFSAQRFAGSWSWNWLACRSSATKWCEPHSDWKAKTIKECRPVACNVYFLCSKQTNACTAGLMHSPIHLYSPCSCFLFLGSSLDHFREILTFVRVVVRLSNAHIMPTLQLQELRKLVVRQVPIILYAKSRSRNGLTLDPKPPPTKQTLSLSGVLWSS